MKPPRTHLRNSVSHTREKSLTKTEPSFVSKKWSHFEVQNLRADAIQCAENALIFELRICAHIFKL